METLLIFIDQLLGGFTIGVTIWHFFIQSPLLVKLMGKEKFVPLMMQLTRLWVKTMFISSSALLVAAAFLSYGRATVPLRFAILGWLGIAINRFLTVPKALKAGARSQKQRKGDDSKDLNEFAVNGGGKSETKVLHQTVVVFVLVMVVGFGGHLIDLTTSIKANSGN